MNALLLITFALAVVVDYVYVLWTKAATTNRPVRAGLTSGLLQVVIITSTMLWISNPLLLVPNVLGHALGSYLAVKYGDNNAG